MRFAKPRSFPERETGLFFLRRAKRTKKHARGLRTSGLRGRFKALPEVILQKFPRHVSKSVLPAKRRRKGFESVRKGYRSADARLIFFEKGLSYCKLTVASDIQKGLLHVSFGAVESWSFAALNRGLQNLGTFQKDLILLVGICYFCVLIRGLQNLGASCERNVFGTFRVYEKYQKYTRGLRTSGLRGRFKALPEKIL